MIEPIHLAGSFTLPGASMTVNRMGYGAMQLAGPEVWGPHATLMLPLLFCERRWSPA